MPETKSNHNGKITIATIITIISMGTMAAIGYGELREKVKENRERIIESKIVYEKEFGTLKSDIKELNKLIFALSTEIKVLNTEMKLRRAATRNKK
jgi:hypothetical protein